MSTGNLTLEYSEYVELLKGYLKDPVVVEVELREAFRVFDKDRNNSLNFVELRRALTHLGEPLSDSEAIELCTMMDADGDNKVDIDGELVCIIFMQQGPIPGLVIPYTFKILIMATKLGAQDCWDRRITNDALAPG